VGPSTAAEGNLPVVVVEADNTAAVALEVVGLAEVHHHLLLHHHHLRHYEGEGGHMLKVVVVL